MRRLVILAGIVVVFCNPLVAAKWTKKKKKDEIPQVLAERLQLMPFYKELRYVSNIKPFREVQAYSYIDGTIERKIKKNGSMVKKGQSVAAVRNITPGYSFSDHIVKAPISGMITDFYEEEGTFVKKNPSTIFKIADISRLRVAVAMLQEDLDLLNQEFRVSLKPKGAVGQIEGKLLRVSPNVDPVLGTSVVEFVFTPPKNSKVRMGMISELVLQHGQVDSIGVDEKYVFESRSKKRKYVFLVKDDSTVEKRYFDEGDTRGGKVQILEGLQKGDLIVTQMPGWNLKNGQVVSVKNKEAVGFKETVPAKN